MRTTFFLIAVFFGPMSFANTCLDQIDQNEALVSEGIQVMHPKPESIRLASHIPSAEPDSLYFLFSLSEDDLHWVGHAKFLVKNDQCVFSFISSVQPGAGKTKKLENL